MGVEGLTAEWVGNTDKGGPQPPYCKGHKGDREMMQYGVEDAVGNVYSEYPRTSENTRSTRGYNQRREGITRRPS